MLTLVSSFLTCMVSNSHKFTSRMKTRAPLHGAQLPLTLILTLDMTSPLKRRPLKIHPLKGRPFKRHPLNRLPLKRCPLKRHPLKRRALQRCPFKRHPSNRHPLKRGPLHLLIGSQAPIAETHKSNISKAKPNSNRSINS